MAKKTTKKKGTGGTKPVTEKTLKKTLQIDGARSEKYITDRMKADFVHQEKTLSLSKTKASLINIAQKLNDFRDSGMTFKDVINQNYEGHMDSDYSNFYRPTDNMYSAASGGYQSDGRLGIADLQYLANYRLGIAYRGTWGVAEDATRNWFNFAEAREDEHQKYKIHNYPKIQKSMIRSGFRRVLPQWVSDARQYGCGFLVKYWGNNDDMASAPPKTPPTRFEAISPVFLTPYNTWKTRGLSWDSDVWEFSGGHLASSNARTRIHRDRIQPLILHPTPEIWRGLSVIDPVSLSLTCYLNYMIFVVRALSKLGNMIPVFKTGKDTPTKADIDSRVAVMEEFAMNGFLIMGKNDEASFPTTNITSGVAEALELFKEDIASGWQVPLNHLMGRSQSGGIGSGGALTAERTYMNTLANLQTSISDEIMRVWEPYYPELEEETLLWNLALQKTDEQRIMEETMAIQRDLMKEQLKQAQMNNKMMRMQLKILDQNKDIFTPTETINTAETIEDFVPKDAEAYRTFQYLSQAQHSIFSNLPNLKRNDVL